MNFMYISMSVLIITIVLSIIAIVSKTKHKCSCPINSCVCPNQDPFPSGTIVVWSGELRNIPTGWAICDGSNGIPDLRAKFVLGQNDGKPNMLGNVAKIGNDILSIRTIGDSGGEETHVLTVDELPSHTHNTTWVIPQGNNGYQGGGNPLTNPSIQPITTATGGNQPHNNMPPYYVLAYIIKM